MDTPLHRTARAEDRSDGCDGETCARHSRKQPMLNARQERVMQLLRERPDRYLYQTRRLFDFAVTYTAGVRYELLNRAEVTQMEEDGLIKRKWLDAPKALAWELSA